jgi:hypothetical protein
MKNVFELIKATKGKNILLSSGCHKSIYHRSPYDLIMMGLLFGMSKN